MTTQGSEGSNAVATTTVVPTVEVGGADGSIANVSRLVYFDYDSYVIKPEFQALIDAHATYLKADGSRKVVIEGHTDERGGREYNLALGQRRAEAVRRALGLLGVADSQIEAVSFGKEKPAEQGSGEAVWSKNRRAEIRYR
jgi:peptidoglycan-associated lipoprotein